MNLPKINPEVLIEKTKVYEKRPAPKGSIYFVARARHNDKIHSIWYLAKAAILFRQDEIELRQHLTDQLIETIELREAIAAAEASKANPEPESVLNKVFNYIKRVWLKKK